MALNVSNQDINLTVAVQTVLAPAALAQMTIIKATAINLDTVPHSITVYRVPNGGSPGSGGTTMLDAFPIGAGDTVTLPLSGQTVVNQQTLQAACDLDDKVNINISFAVTP
jgi:hypothetical protein